jgi:hypothetical protein
MKTVISFMLPTGVSSQVIIEGYYTPTGPITDNVHKVILNNFREGANDAIGATSGILYHYFIAESVTLMP